MDHPLRVLGGAMCLVAVAIAAVTARFAMREPLRRTRYISEVLATWLRRGRDGRKGLGWWGSALSSLLLGAGSILFAVEASRRAGLDGGASFATAVTLLAVALIPLRTLDDPATAHGLDFAHPFAAAAFYLAALLLALIALRDAGPVGRALAIVHVVSSGSLIALSVTASFLEFGARGGASPVLGTRILLDLRPDSRARWVRWFQWPATFVVGLALCLGAIGV